MRKHTLRIGTTIGLALILLAGQAAAQIQKGGGGIGPDLVLDDIYNEQLWGRVGDIVAYSIGTEICNLGDENGDWFANSNRHPVIAQNMYRLKDDRMEQIGMSWLKHGFASVNGNACGNCQNPGSGSLLGVGCSDPYGSGLNGDQNGSGGVGGLGPRSEVNAATGEFLWPYGSQGQSGDAIYKRLQVHVDDVEPALNQGARYFLEGQYVARDEAEAGNGGNNPSYREVSVNDNLSLSFVGTPTQPQRDALMAWQDIDPTVQLAEVTIPADGLLRLATKVIDLGNGQWRYEYALHNINSDRSIMTFSVPVPEDVNVTNAGFSDVDYHSGEPYDLTDWFPVGIGDTSGFFRWSTVPFASNPNANALRWGTTYNFWFDADAPPVSTQANLRPFKVALSATGVWIDTQAPSNTSGPTKRLAGR